MITSTVQVHNLTKFYGKLQVIDNISLEVNRGEFVSIVGPSGCGKTTLLKIIGGLTKPSSGEVLLDGLPPIQRRREGYLGFVFQNPVLLPWRTLEQNVRLPLEVLHQNGFSTERIGRVLDMLGLSGFENAYPKQLSGGMQQRAALARVLLYEPSLLLMDEPFGAVDEITRSRLNFELLKVWEEFQMTVLFVTHALDEAILLSDRVVLLSQRPAKIDQIFTVRLPRPRSTETLNLGEFHDLVRWTRERLNAASLI
jgi:NitT/TauT family transport system ATP-binding protein